MPENSSPFDDPFADLFGKLPDPRQRETTREAQATGQTSTAQPPAAPAARASADAGEPAGAATPLSRRAAREAAAQAPSEGRPAAPAPRQAEPAPRQAAPAPAESLAPTEPARRDVTAAASAPAVPAVPGTPAATARATAPVRTASAATPVPTADIEDLFAGVRTTHDVGAPPPPRDKRRRRIGGWIALGVVLVILAGIAGGGLWVWNTYQPQIRELMGWTEPKDYPAGMANGETYVTIVSGDTGSPISQSLFDAGVTKTPSAFYDYLIETAQNPPFVPGVFKLQQQMTSEAALAALLDPASKMENTAQLREGLTVAQSLPILAEGTGVPLADLQTAAATPSTFGVSADSLEGWLFPATYSFNPGVTATEVIQTLVNRAVQSLDTAGVPVEDRQRILTIASIIQREARFTADFYKVSRVIQNRLDPGNQETFGLLQMDSTAQYGYGEMHDGTVSSSAAALADDNPWNTYVRAGLPVGPIANPGDTAIDAAMHPADGDWLYFVTVNLDTGETVFTNNLNDHNKAVAQWQAWCSANPDSGC